MALKVADRRVQDHVEKELTDGLRAEGAECEHQYLPSSSERYGRNRSSRSQLTEPYVRDQAKRWQNAPVSSLQVDRLERFV